MTVFLAHPVAEVLKALKVNVLFVVFADACSEMNHWRCCIQIHSIEFEMRILTLLFVYANCCQAFTSGATFRVPDERKQRIYHFIVVFIHWLPYQNTFTTYHYLFVVMCWSVSFPSHLKPTMVTFLARSKRKRSSKRSSSKRRYRLFWNAWN